MIWGLSAPSPELGGGDAEFALEGAVEGGLGFVAGGFGDFGQARVVGGEEAGCEVEAPAGEVGDGGLAEAGLKARGEDGAGEAAFVGEGGEGPGFGGAAVEER